MLAAMAVLALASLALLAVAAPRDLNGTVVFSPGLAQVQNYRIPSTGGKQPKLVAFAEARDGGDSSASRIAVRTSTDGAHARTA